MASYIFFLGYTWQIQGFQETEIKTHIDNTSIFSSAICCNKAANGEAWVAVLLTILHVIAPSDRHVVNDPEKKIVYPNNLFE